MSALTVYFAGIPTRIVMPASVAALSLPTNYTLPACLTGHTTGVNARLLLCGAALLERMCQTVCLNLRLPIAICILFG